MHIPLMDDHATGFPRLPATSQQDSVQTADTDQSHFNASGAANALPNSFFLAMKKQLEKW